MGDILGVPITLFRSRIRVFLGLLLGLPISGNPFYEGGKPPIYDGLDLEGAKMSPVPAFILGSESLCCPKGSKVTQIWYIELLY